MQPSELYIIIILFMQAFQRKNVHAYSRELAIYNLPNFKHPNILLFISNREYPTELHLIFEYHPMGSLYDVLTNKQAICTRQFYDISTSAAKGMYNALVYIYTIHTYNNS